MARSCIYITVITILSMFSLVVCKPFLGDLLARAIASSSSPDDPQSHISDFRNMTKMDTKAEKLQHVPAQGGSSSNQTLESLSESLSDVELPENRPQSFIMRLPASSLWQSWNRTKILSRIVDDIVRPVHERISLVFHTLVARAGPKDSSGDMAHGNSKLEELEKLLTNSTDDSDSEELVAELDLLHPEGEPALIDPSMNGSTLLGRFQVRRNILRRRVAKALSSITGLLILAVNSRRESKPRTRRSLEASTESEALLGDRPDFLDVVNEIDTDGNDDPKVTELLETEDKLDQPASEVTPRRNFETVGIFILEVFGSIAGFSWGIFKQVQSLFG